MNTLQQWQQWYHSAGRKESKEILLEHWDNRLAAQNAYFDRYVARRVGHVHVLGEKNVAYLQGDESLAKPAIEKAVAAFIREGSWPPLTCDECLHLMVRVYLARQVLAAIRRGTPQGMVIQSQMPDLQDREHVIQWFLMDLWNLGGKAFLAAMARGDGVRSGTVALP
jgi:hypothetical protein